MAQTRGILVPVEHLTAEMAALPLASPASLRLSVTQFEAKMNGVMGALWRETEAELVGAFPSFSIDELLSLRDWLWFHNAPKDKPVYFSDYLARVASATLKFNGNVFQPCLPPWASNIGDSAGSSEDAHARRFWRWISFALPPDLLMAAHPTPDAVSAKIDLVSPLLTRILQDQGYSEPHMHVGAAMDFPLLWITTMHALAHQDMVDEHSFHSPGAQFNEGRELSHWLIRTAINRYLIGVFLDQVEETQYRNFDQFLEHKIFKEFQPNGEHYDPMAESLLRTALRELATGKFAFTTSFISLQRLYVKLTSIRARWPTFPNNLEEAYHADPLQSVFPARGIGQRSSEMEWISRGLSYLNKGGNQNDRVFSHLFWQSVRVRNLYYRYVVQRPLTPGLQWFVRFFLRMKIGRSPISLQLNVESAAMLCGKGMGLKAMEFRTTPKSTQSKMERVVREVKKAIDRLEGENNSSEQNQGSLITNREPIEYGLILHFARERGGGANKGLPTAKGVGSNADPSWNKNVGYRFGRFYKEKRQEALTLARLIQRYPRVLSIIRGIDICTDENGVPNWVLAPLMRYVREVSLAASSELQSQWKEELPPLRTTIHVGEEYVHLLTGLRRIDETIDFNKLTQGDRLGHAMALGVEPREWARQSSGIAVTQMDRLLDLAWEWSFSTTRGLDISGARIQYIFDQIRRLSSDIFGEYADPTQVVKFSEILGSEDELRMINFPSGPLPDVEEYLKSRRAQLLPENIGKRGDTEADYINNESNEDLQDKVNRIEKNLSSAYKIQQGDEPWRLFANYITDPATFQRGQMVTLVDPSFEAETLYHLQNELRRKVGALGITVEINPSSNLLVGNLADLDTHPLWRLKPPRPNNEIPSVAVCIGSDDPLTFSTKTREEYQLIYDTLTLAGLSDNEARQWLNEARETGLISRFTLKKAETSERIWTGMTVDISHLKPLL